MIYDWFMLIELSSVYNMVYAIYIYIYMRIFIQDGYKTKRQTSPEPGRLVNWMVIVSTTVTFRPGCDL